MTEHVKKIPSLDDADAREKLAAYVEVIARNIGFTVPSQKDTRNAVIMIYEACIPGLPGVGMLRWYAHTNLILMESIAGYVFDVGVYRPEESQKHGSAFYDNFVFLEDGTVRVLSDAWASEGSRRTIMGWDAGLLEVCKALYATLIRLSDSLQAPKNMTGRACTHIQEVRRVDGEVETEDQYPIPLCPRCGKQGACTHLGDRGGVDSLYGYYFKCSSCSYENEDSVYIPYDRDELPTCPYCHRTGS
jgi:hypothetical protein